MGTAQFQPKTVMRERPLKVLRSDSRASRSAGSEPSVGWNVAWRAAQYGPVWVITDPSHREKIESWLVDHPGTDLHMAYHPMPSWTQWMWRIQFTVNVYYYLWNIGAAKLAKRMHAEHHFDVVHHVTYVRYWMPSAGAALGIPFVWGPVGGGESAPPGFLRGVGLKGLLEENLRALMRWVFERDPRLRRTAEAATVAIACSEDTAARMRRLGVQDLRVMSSIAITPGGLGEVVSRPPDGKVRFISVGRLLHWKGFHFGLEAFAKADLPNAEFVVVGRGPELERLKRLVDRLGITEKVTFTGELAWRDGLLQFQQADVLVHPSLHDSGGFVLLEAMEMRKPVICLDLGGPGVYVNGNTGYAVTAKSIPQVIHDLATAMKALAADPELRRSLGEAGHQRAVNEFTWQRKGADMERIYQEVAGSTL
ncbi:MAG: glycosyltransferase family 4 protein [Flavobacteriales bacterium]|nr:glycosyltransferase family 4 protein [Flavobacteriales bacterium]